MADDSPWSRFRSEFYAVFGRNPKTNRQMAQVAALDAHHVVLDIGCGAGAAVRAAAATVQRAVGVDRSAPMVAIAERRSRDLDNVEFAVAGAESLPFADATFHRVWAIQSFHHWEDRDQGLAEVARVLRPGGRLFIVESETKGAHGLSRSAAEQLASGLEAMAFDRAWVEKPHRHLVVAAQTPGVS